MPNSFRASGISCQPTLFVDPVLCVAAPMAGARQDHQLLMPFVSHREKYIISPYIDWLSFFFNRSWRKPMDGIASLMIKLADVEQFVALVNDSLYSLLKYPETVTIDEMRIFRHEHAILQYQESSDDRYAIVEALQQRYPGLGIAGNLRGGIGMADRMKQGAEVGK